MQGVETMTDRQAVITELRDWATITGQPLPYAAEVIADLEERGFCVDLVDGAVFWSASSPAYAEDVTPYYRLARRAMQMPALPSRREEIAQLRAVLDEMERQAVR